MEFGKIIVKSKYEKKGDLVFRPLIRAYGDIDAYSFLDDGNVVLLGVVRGNVFYELFTWKPIPYSNFEYIDLEEFYNIINRFSLDKIRILKKVINNLIFSKGELPIYGSLNIEELAKDRAIEFDAYEKKLTSINPYQEPLNGYNDFTYKCKVLEKNKKSRKIV